MPILKTKGAELYYEEFGIGPEVMLFSHGLFLNSEVFRDQFEYFKARYRCVIYDQRGHGKSRVLDEEYGIEAMLDDVVYLIQSLSIGPCHFVGMSTGGFIAMNLARKHRELFKSLILINTSANAEKNRLRLNLLKTTISVFGIKPSAKRILKMLFSEEFLADEERRDQVVRWREIILLNSKKSLTKSLTTFINRQSVIKELDDITMPTLVISCDGDQLISSEMSRNIKLKIPQAALALIKHVGHVSTVEEPWQVNDSIEVFLNGVH